jgi:hypothetical protein
LDRRLVREYESRPESSVSRTRWASSAACDDLCRLLAKLAAEVLRAKLKRLVSRKS